MVLSHREKDEMMGIACKLWSYLNACEWEKARYLLSEDFEAVWPQSRERIVGPDNFIALNREYPGKGEIQVQDVRYGYEPWDKIHEITTTVKIKWKKPEGRLVSLSLKDSSRLG